jgi:hypothetical protein
MLNKLSSHFEWYLQIYNISSVNDLLTWSLFSSGLTAISTYLLTSELWSKGAGLFAACFIAIVPGYISRSVAGSYDNEGIAIFALQFTYYLWVKSVKTGSIFWSTMTALSYFYMVSCFPILVKFSIYIKLNVCMYEYVLYRIVIHAFDHVMIFSKVVVHEFREVSELVS